jgi:hypothetical protein
LVALLRGGCFRRRVVPVVLRPGSCVPESGHPFPRVWPLRPCAPRVACGYDSSSTSLLLLLIVYCWKCTWRRAVGWEARSCSHADPRLRSSLVGIQWGTPELVALVCSVDALARGILALEAAGHSPSAISMYDEAWAVQAAVASFLAIASGGNTPLLDWYTFAVHGSGKVPTYLVRTTLCTSPSTHGFTLLFGARVCCWHE